MASSPLDAPSAPSQSLARTAMPIASVSASSNEKVPDADTATATAAAAALLSQVSEEQAALTSLDS